MGTLPSIKSLELQQYYGNPQNSFWKILFKNFNKDYSSNYYDKTLLAIDNNIAIWDVCHSANRKGSMDSEIKDEIPNEIDKLITANSTIRKIAFNGQNAAKLYHKYFPKFEKVEYFTLLSTSPANARYNFEDKLKNWNQIRMHAS